MQFRETQTLSQLAQYLSGSCAQSDDLKILGVATLKEATPSDITFLTQAQYLPQLAETKAAAVVIHKQYAEKSSLPTIMVDDPHVAFAKLMQLCVAQQKAQSGIHPSAYIAKTAVVSPSALIEAHAYIGENVRIDDDAHIGPGVSIGENSHIGAHTRIYANASIYSEVKIGKHCIIHSNAVIGADGFGFANDKGHWLKIPQLGGVEIGDEVEIGAQSAVDRGVLTPTRVGNDVKIDNLVQIGHNVQIGDHTIISGCVAIAGSTTIGKHCAIGGGCCLNGHIQITDGVQITAMSGVLNGIDKPGIYSGIPAITNGEWRKQMVAYLRLPEIMKRLKALEKK
ncbi:MAG: UDP-3-O-(3-hydroxymyristoyl)glucosamine N-acyltransferase [Gammaproteobacteria bacterium]|jgi:UDP-3-O-[3-hydroxymyristoyl] glucosamine N-acyltransferase